MLPIFQIESFVSLIIIMGFPGSANGEVYLPASAGDIKDTGLIPELGRSPGGGRGSPPQYSCLKNPWTEDPGGLQSLGLQRVGQDLATEPVIMTAPQRLFRSVPHVVLTSLC